VAGIDRALARRLETLAGLRAVFVAGLPGTGKSLLIHQLAHLAASRGRVVHLLQWDVARPVFEATDAGRRYPLVDGVTHAVIRKAAGGWVRSAVAAWDARHRDRAHLLVGEAPFVGHRFVELARPGDDAAEPLLRSAATRFVVPVPSREVRAFLEAERERRTRQPLHRREREDAPPHVLQELWHALAEVAVALGLGRPPTAIPPWDPALYARVYAAVLRHRRVEVVPLDTVLPTQAFSVYDFTPSPHDLVPTPEEAEASIVEIERQYPDGSRLGREVERWWVV
jgi:hypothetical protein